MSKKKYLNPHRRNPVSERLDPLAYYTSITNSYNDNNPGLKAFFSRRNVNFLQDLLKKEVYKRSDGIVKIGDQDEQALLDIMIEEYQSYPYEKYFYQPCFDESAVSIYDGSLTQEMHVSIEEMIGDLNKRVFEIAYPRIAKGLQQFYRFKEHLKSSKSTAAAAMSNRFPGQAGINTRLEMKDEKPIDNYEQNSYNAPASVPLKSFVGARPKRVGEKTETFGQVGNKKCIEPVTIENMQHDDIRQLYMRNMSRCAHQANYA